MRGKHQLIVGISYIFDDQYKIWDCRNPFLPQPPIGKGIGATGTMGLGTIGTTGFVTIETIGVGKVLVQFQYGPGTITSVSKYFVYT